MCDEAWAETIYRFGYEGLKEWKETQITLSFWTEKFEGCYMAFSNIQISVFWFFKWLVNKEYHEVVYSKRDKECSGEIPVAFRINFKKTNKSL